MKNPPPRFRLLPRLNNDRRAFLLLAALVLATALPFVTRAYFIDDFYFVTMAKGILHNPLRPYDFISEDAGPAHAGWNRGQRPRMINPPLFHYYLAGVMKLGGDAAWKLRTAALIFPILSVFAMFKLGKRFVKDPLAAASLMAVTPAFWISSYALAIDSALLTFFIWSMWAFLEGQESRRWKWMLLSGFLMGLAALTKYTGLMIVPLVLVGQVLWRDRFDWRRTAIALTVFSAIFLLWGEWGVWTYGQSHFLAALPRGLHSLSTGGSWLTVLYLDKFFPVASFLGGGTIFLLGSWILLWERSRPVALLNMLIAVMLFALFQSAFGGFSRGQSATLAVFIGSTLAFLILCGFTFFRQRRGEERINYIWLGIGLVELVVAMPWTAARYLLLILPPVCWMFRKWMEDSNHRWLWRSLWGMTALMGAALAYVDYAQAGVVVHIAQVLGQSDTVLERLAPRPPHSWYFLGDTFTGLSSYLEPLGWKNAFPDQEFHRGDLLLRCHYRLSSWWTLPHPERFRAVAAWEFKDPVPLRVMDVPASAGFYASAWGSLPFAITRDPLERFELYRVQE